MGKINLKQVFRIFLDKKKDAKPSGIVASRALTWAIHLLYLLRAEPLKLIAFTWLLAMVWVLFPVCTNGSPIELAGEDGGVTIIGVVVWFTNVRVPQNWGVL